MMLIKQGQMGVIKATCLGFLVVLLFESFAVSLGYTKEEEGEGALLDQLVDPTTGKIDDHLAELLWTNCRQDLNDLKGAFEDPELRLSEETQSTTNDIDPKGDSLTKESFQKLINVLHPQLKRVLSDCIKKKNLLSQDTGQDSGFKTCYPPNSVSLFRWCEVPKRSLATESIAVDSASNLGPPSPRSPPPASSLAYESTDSGSDPSLSLAFSTSPATINNFNRAVRKLEGNPDEAHEGHHTAEEDAEHMKLIIIACVATAVVTSLVAVLVLVLCFRRNSGAAVNDESPLLRLKSENSGGSSQAANDSNPNKNVSSNGNDDIESDALKISLDGESSQGDVANGAAQASSESSETPGNAGLQLPLPPGRAGTSPGGMPPLKPPPGREDLKPEAPAPAKSGPPPPPPPSNAGPRPPGPPPPPGPPGAKPGPPPPPPPKGGAPPPPPPKAGGPPKPPPSLGSKAPKAPNAIGRGPVDSGKAKLKPFFWDKVSATPEQGQVWNQIKAGSFQFNEEKIESLFGYLPEKSKSERKAQSTSQEPQFIQLLDQKKARNLSILLKALNVTSEEVSDALTEGNELPTELLQTLLKMAPTSEEELKLRLYTGEISQLGPAERFLKVLVDIPHAFQRMETLQFMCSLHEELTATRESFETLEEACKVLKSSRLFLKLLEAVLKTGNRMNDGTFRGGAMAFKLDTLLKLADVKGVDGKTTLLHFVVLEIIRSEGLRAARVARESKSFNSIKSEDLVDDVSPDAEERYRSLGLQAVSNLSNDLEYVKKAAALDAEGLTGTVAKLGHAMVKTRNFLNTEMKESEEKSGFHETLKDFVQNAEPDVMSLLQEEKKIMDLVKGTGDYFHGNVKKDEGLRLFTVVRDFLKILDKVCIEVKTMKPPELPKKQVSDASSSSESRAASPSTDPHQKPSQKRADDSGSDSTSVEKGRKPAEAPKEHVSNASSSSESRVAPPSPDPREKLAHAISQQRADDSGSDSSSDEKSEKPAGAPKKQVSNASSSSESRVIPDPREKLAHAISQQRVDDFGSDSSSDEKSEKPAGAPKKQVSNASSSSESRVISDPREKLAHAISQQRVDDSGSNSSSDEKSEKPAGAPKKQVSNASSSSESRVIPDPREKLAHAISQQRLVDSGSDSSSDEKTKKPAGAPKKQVSNASSSSESRVIPNPREKLAHSISQQRVDDSGSDSNSDEKSKKPAEAPKKQVSNASSSSESRVIPPSPDPREKLAHVISQQREDDSSFDSSSDENS